MVPPFSSISRSRPSGHSLGRSSCCRRRSCSYWWATGSAVFWQQHHVEAWCPHELRPANRIHWQIRLVWLIHIVIIAFTTETRPRLVAGISFTYTCPSHTNIWQSNPNNQVLRLYNIDRQPTAIYEYKFIRKHFVIDNHRHQRAGNHVVLDAPHDLHWSQHIPQYS